MGDGVSIVIPSANRYRLDLLAATLASMRRCAAVEQIIVAEMGASPCALELAQAQGVEHIFTHMAGAFDRAHMLNSGSALARGKEILWCDGDFLFEPEFVARAQREMRACDADYFYPHSRMDYLGEADSRHVLAGVRHPGDCHPIRSMAPMTGNPGGMGMVRTDFVRRYGGMVDGFRGWGCEDHAWLRKAMLLGKVDVSRHPDQRTWHLYHPDSGSHSERALNQAIRRNPHYAANALLMHRINAIGSGEEFLRQFPPPSHFALPWARSARLLFVVAADSPDMPAAARAVEWGQRIERTYGLGPKIIQADPRSPDGAVRDLDADAILGFADDNAGCHALMAALGTKLMLLVTDAARPARVPLPVGPAPMILARTSAQVNAWRRRGIPVWHRPWRENDAPGSDVAPPLVAPLSFLLGATRLWRIRIELDRTALPAPALDRPRFWYVGLHDTGDAEIARQDLCGIELQSVLADASRPIIIERAAASPLPPATWTIWPTDRHGRWLDKLSGTAQAEDLGHSWSHGGR